MALRLFLIILFLVAPACATAQTDAQFQAWYDQFSRKALAEGISPSTLTAVSGSLLFDDTVIDLDRRQPESKQSFATYLRRTVPPLRVKKARALMHKNQNILRKIQLKTGIPAAIIVALWGKESNFGSNMGGYEVANSLATLSFEGRRAAFFEKELIEALHVMEEEKLAPADLLGSWAGAMGQCQFMPSTFRHYAVDFDGDGKRDIWENEADVFASIANYLSASGWKRDLLWGREVKLTRHIDSKRIGLSKKYKLKDWAKRGVRKINGKPLPSVVLSASLVQPDGVGGRSFLVYDNFRVLMRWNRSTYFATAVGLFADQLSGGK